MNRVDEGLDIGVVVAVLVAISENQASSRVHDKLAWQEERVVCDRPTLLSMNSDKVLKVF